MASEAYTQSELGSVEAALAFFRQPIPSNLPPHLVPFLQATLWEKLGDLETALLFMKEAERFDSQPTAVVLSLLYRLGKRDEAEECAERIIARRDASPADLYLAAYTFLPRARELDKKQAAPVFQRVATILKRAEALAINRDDLEIPGLDVRIALTLGLCYEELGDVGAAVRVYTTAIDRHPKDVDLLAFRGLAQYNNQPQLALQDFLAATRLGARSINPWHVLSRHALMAGANGEALRLALQAAERAGSHEVRAEVHETIAIALANLGQPRDRVLQNFDEALNMPQMSQRRFTIDRVHLDRLRKSRSREVASRQDAEMQEREARISDSLLAVA